MLLEILGGLALMAVGTLVVIKSEAIFSFFGPIAFFDKYLGTEGGSRLGWKLIGVLMVFIGVLTATGQIGSFVNWGLSPLLGLGNR